MSENKHFLQVYNADRRRVEWVNMHHIIRGNPALNETVLRLTSGKELHIGSDFDALYEVLELHGIPVRMFDLAAEGTQMFFGMPHVVDCWIAKNGSQGMRLANGERFYVEPEDFE